jgi:hypothetical protein
MEESDDLRRATALWRAAYRYQMEAKLDRAIEHYQRSVAPGQLLAAPWWRVC